MLGKKKIVKNGDVVFVEDSASIKNDLEMHPGGRNKGHTMVVVYKSSKLPLLDSGG